MKKRFVVSMLFGILFLGLTLIPAVSADDSCWESTETHNGNLISKVENPVHCVYDDDPSPLDTYEDYPIWVYGRFFDVWWYSSIQVKIYVQAFYHVDSFRYGWPTGSQEYWADAPYGMFKWNGDYDYQSEVPSSITWSVSASAKGELPGVPGEFQLGISATFTDNPASYYFEENNEYGTDVGSWRYMGWFESRYSKWGSPTPQEFSALLKLHIIHSVADDYYDGVYWGQYRYSRMTYIEAFRFKLEFNYYGGLGGPYITTHTHIMGDDNPSDEDVDGIPLCIGIMNS